MTQSLRDNRHRTTLLLGAATAGLWLLVWLSSFVGASSSFGAETAMGRPVLEGFAAARPDVSAIRFTMADDRYTLERTAEGWTMRESGGYPIRRDRLSELATGLELLTYDAARTRDPEKLSQIGVSDPQAGGNGVLIEVFDANSEVQHALIAGRKQGRIYVRAPGAVQAYRAGGDLPPFYNRRAWLDFDILQIDQSAIRSVRLFDQTGAELYLTRPAGGDRRSFVPAPPFEDLRLQSALAASTTALAITRLAPSDAKPVSALTSEPVARHISETFDGLEVDLSAYRERDGLWVTLRAIEAGEGARRAAAINTKTEGWAFRLPDYDFQDFTPLLSSLVSAPEPTDNEPS
ncbi:MAG: DUF4340 domain-containing protein [Pseudomonadota bacterium]